MPRRLRQMDDESTAFYEKIPIANAIGIFAGAVNQIRTGDLILTKDVLYHLSHNSIHFQKTNSER